MRRAVHYILVYQVLREVNLKCKGGEYEISLSMGEIKKCIYIWETQV